MGSTFNPQILVEKLAKLNSSQQSIETLSHWCIFHMNKAKLVVETWDRQFHTSPPEQRLAFLYLANDILQNSRRKGAEFVAEFWRVLPEALRDVIRNGDEFGKNAARRLISIWDERKVFGSRGHILKEEFMAKQPENNDSKTGRQLSLKFRLSIGNILDKIVSDYETIYGGQLDEDALLSRCTNTISCLEKLIKDNNGDINSGNFSGSGVAEEMQGQHTALKECIEQLTILEASRASLVSNLKRALQEQELKLDQVRNQLQAAHLQSEEVANVSRHLVRSNSNMLMEEQGMKDGHASSVPPGFTLGDMQANTVVYTRQVTQIDKSAASAEDDSRKSAAAAVAAKLTASTASAEMLSHVLTSLVSGFGNSTDSSSDPYHSDKRPKLENETSSYAPALPLPPPLPQNQQPPPPLPPFPHPESLQQNQNANTTPTNQQSTAGEQPPPPSSSPPPLPPLPPMPLYPMPPQFIQAAGSMSNVAYNYGVTPQQPPLSAFPSVGAPVTGMSPYAAPPVNPYQPFPGSESGFYSPSSSVSMAPISRQQTL